jgi:hypothetical protein
MSFSTLILGTFHIDHDKVDNFKKQIEEYDFNRNGVSYFKNVYGTYNEMYYYTLVPFAVEYRFKKDDFEEWLHLFEDFIKELSFFSISLHVDIENYGNFHIVYVKIDDKIGVEKRIYSVHQVEIDKL